MSSYLYPGRIRGEWIGVGGTRSEPTVFYQRPSASFLFSLLFWFHHDIQIPFAYRPHENGVISFTLVGIGS